MVPNAIVPNTNRWKWPTTQYESCVIKSNGIAVLTTPPAPAEKNNAIPPTANIIGVANLILPFHIVARKLKTCIAEAGTAANVPIINTVFSVNDIPVANM